MDSGTEHWLSPFHTPSGRYIADAMLAEREAWREVEQARRDAERRKAYLGRFAGQTIDAGRLERSLGLTVEPIGAEQFRVTGGSSPHYVNLAPDAAVPCDCADYARRGGVCKHIAASLRAVLAEVA
jgi:hypothetical protein